MNSSSVGTSAGPSFFLQAASGSIIEAMRVAEMIRKLFFIFFPSFTLTSKLWFDYGPDHGQL
jgi:hypothetical protein